MFENFKTDIIYYNTATDFELEFNLCGCCRMRLFNDKCADKKSLLMSLSRAVSRSKVTIITAPLFSEDKIIQTVASAIGGKTEVVDNARYKIASENEITVIKGSLPLVTEDGIFGGCLIESGPQSLIILTDNKAVRKTIMKTLLHQYIAEVSMRPDQNDNNIITDDPVTEPEEETPETEAIEETEETEPQTPLVLDEGETEEESEQNQGEEGENNSLIIDCDEEEDASSEYEPEIEGLYTDISSDTRKEKDNDVYYYGDSDYYTDEEDSKPSPFNIWMLVISIVLLVALAVLCYCIFYVPTKAGVSPSAYLKDIFDTMFK